MVGGWQNGQSELEVGGASGVEGSEMGEGPQKRGRGLKKGEEPHWRLMGGKGARSPRPLFSNPPPTHTLSPLAHCSLAPPPHR